MIMDSQRMTDFECPNCGHHLGSLDVKPSEWESDKDTRTDGVNGGAPLGPNDPARYSFSAPDKGNEGGGAKQRLSSGLTRADVAEIRRLYEQGISLARIRQQLGLAVSLNRLQTVVNKPW
jgi:hypothetical protein